MLKLFIAEQGSDKMLRFAEAEDDRNKVVSVLARVEARSAIARLRGGSRMTPAEGIAASAALEAEVERMIEQLVNPAVLESAIALIDRHDLRALDAVQLGSAVVSRSVLAAPDMRLIASDKALLEAAREESFDVWDPTTAFFRVHRNET